ncbi:MAG: hypothetical protein H6652_05985 [Ardenticatenaceae bacterium]|nr:hypothetical protein [Ardenticatenaceae bacterium]
MSETDPQTSGDHIEVGKIKNGKAIAIGRGATAVYQGLTYDEVVALLAELKNQDQPTVWNGRIPYLGLSAYQEADARYFFGRESLVEQLLQRVQTANFITIAGPSGSGKSSVARAGLFHALRQGTKIENSDRWRLATMQPKGNPIEQLAQAIERLTKTPGTGDHLRQNSQKNPLALHQQAETLLSEDPSQRFVLLVDQFEELFTQTKDAAVRQTFINLLTEAAQAADSRCRILISLRSDFVSNCASHEQLRELMSQQFQLVGAMAPRDLAKAITLPALEVGAEIDPKLVSQIIADMKGSPDALPLMSFALRDLFEVEKTQKGKPMDLTLPEYVQRGGLEKALEEHANKVFNNFTAEQKEIAKNIFSKLIEVGQGRVDTRRTATFAELVPAGSSAAAVTTVLSDLADVRLVTTSDLAVVEGQPVTTSSQEATVTIAHEKMIDAWPWLRTLVDENRDLIALQNQINNDAKAWAKEQDKGYLYRGARLAQMKAKLAELKPGLNNLAETFIQACLEEEEAERKAKEERIQKEEALRQEQANAGRFRRLTRWLTVAAVIAVIATIVALIFLNNSVRQTYAARQAQGEAVANQQEAVAARATSDFNAAVASTRETDALAAEAEARMAEATSEANASLASTREAEALAAEAEVQQLKTIIQANQLAGLVPFEVENDPERALLMAVAGFRLSQQPNTYSSLVTALQTPYRTSLRGHKDAVWSATFSPDGERIVTASSDGTVRMWDLVGNELAVLSGHGGWVRSATFSPNGERIVTATDGTVRLWDQVGNELVVLSVNGVRSATFSPDGEQIVTASRDGTARLWDLAGDELAVLNGHGDWVNSATFSPDGKQIMTASDDGTVRLWDLAGNELAMLSGFGDLVNSATFSLDLERVVTANGDRTARLWDLAGNELGKFSGHGSEVYSATFSPNGEQIVTANDDGTARLWDLAGNELAVLNGHEGGVWSATFSPDGKQILTASRDGTARLWDLAGDELAVLNGHGDWVNSATFSPDGKQIMTASDDGTVRLWDLAGNELAVLNGHEGGVWSATFSPDGEQIVTASRDGTARLWDLAGYELAVLIGHEDWVNSATFSPDGERIVTASRDGTVRVWDLAGNELAILSGNGGGVWSAMFSPDGEQIVTAGDDGTARLWDLTGNELVTFNGHMNVVNLATFSPDGERIVTASRDWDARLWDLAGNALAILNRHGDWVRTATFSPDGEQILTASDDGTARLWDLAGNELMVLNEHEKWVWSAMFSPDGERIVTANWDWTARIWPNYTKNYIVSQAFNRTQRGLNETECQQYFRDDLEACPRSKRALFEPLVAYLTPEQQADWQSLKE